MHDDAIWHKMHDKSQRTSSGALKGVHLKGNMLYLILSTRFEHPDVISNQQSQIQMKSKTLYILSTFAKI